MAVAAAVVAGSTAAAASTAGPLLANRPTGMTVTVPPLPDAKDQVPGDGKCDVDKNTLGNQCTLRAAIMEANFWGPGSNINIKLGTGTFTLSLPGADDDTAQTGDLDVLTDVTFNGTGTRDAVIAGVDLGDRLIDVPAGVAPTVTLSGVVLQGGGAPAGEDGGAVRYQGSGELVMTNFSVQGNVAGGSGGGLYMNRGTLSITGNDVFDSNRAGGNGGAIDFEGSVPATLANLTVRNNQATNGAGVAAYTQVGSGGTLVVASSTFANNEATGSGGGLYQGAGILAATSPNTFDGNIAGANGGGADIEGSTWATVQHLTASNNRAANGGGLSAFAVEGATGTMTISGQSLFDTNLATGNGGGLDVTRTTMSFSGVFRNNAKNGGGLQIRGSEKATTLTGRVQIGYNAASDNGGGIYAIGCTSTLPCTVESTVVGYHKPALTPIESDRNTAGLAGSGIYVTGSLTVNASTIAGNAITGPVPGDGGAVYHAAGSGSLTLVNDTIANNDGGLAPGGVVIASSTVDQLTNDTIARNTGTGRNAVALAPTGAPPTAKNTILATPGLLGTCTPGAVASLGHNLDSDNVCFASPGTGDILNTDPKLVELRDNGSGTNTMRPATSGGSPVQDKGTNNGCPGQDQRFVIRPQKGTCDIGAYENSTYTANSQVRLAIVASSSQVGKGAQLTYSITVTNAGPRATIGSQINAVLPNSVGVVSCSWVNGANSGGCIGTGANVTANVGSIPGDQTNPGTVTVAIVALVSESTADTSLTTTSTVSSQNPDTFQYDNTGISTVQIL